MGTLRDTYTLPSPLYYSLSPASPLSLPPSLSPATPTSLSLPASLSLTTCLPAFLSLSATTYTFYSLTCLCTAHSCLPRLACFERRRGDRTFPLEGEHCRQIACIYMCLPEPLSLEREGSGEPLSGTGFGVGGPVTGRGRLWWQKLHVYMYTWPCCDTGCDQKNFYQQHSLPGYRLADSQPDRQPTLLLHGWHGKQPSLVPVLAAVKSSMHAFSTLCCNSSPPPPAAQPLLMPASSLPSLPPPLLSHTIVTGWTRPGREQLAQQPSSVACPGRAVGWCWVWQVMICLPPFLPVKTGQPFSLCGWMGGRKKHEKKKKLKLKACCLRHLLSKHACCTLHTAAAESSSHCIGISRLSSSLAFAGQQTQNMLATPFYTHVCLHSFTGACFILSSTCIGGIWHYYWRKKKSWHLAAGLAHGFCRQLACTLAASACGLISPHHSLHLHALGPCGPSPCHWPSERQDSPS